MSQPAVADTDERRRTQAEARALRAAARAAARAVPPTRNPQLAHLTLAGLRHYRAALGEEENRVSYWRRILQARLDTLGLPAHGADTDHLRGALASSQTGSGRTALVQVLPVDDMPPLPDLAELWDAVPDVTDDLAVRAAERQLRDAELRLSEYRNALHVRLSAATGELIARYREEPTLCLSALPL